MALYATRRRLVEAIQFCPHPIKIAETVAALSVLGIRARVMAGGPVVASMLIDVPGGGPLAGQVVTLKLEPHWWVVISGADMVSVHPPEAFDELYEVEEINNS